MSNKKHHSNQSEEGYVSLPGEIFGMNEWSEMRLDPIKKL